MLAARQMDVGVVILHEGEDHTMEYNRVREISQQHQVVDKFMLRLAGNIFVKHQMDRTLGLALLHRHQKLEPGFVMVHTESAADEDLCMMHALDKSKLYPFSFFMGSQSTFRPQEFSTSPHSTPSDSFLSDMGLFLRKHNLEQVLSITHISSPEELWIERQLPNGKGTIAKRVEADDHVGDGVVTVWGFGLDGSRVKVTPLRKCETAQSGGHKVT